MDRGTRIGRRAKMIKHGEVYDVIKEELGT